MRRFGISVGVILLVIVVAIQDGQISLLDRQQSKTPGPHDHIDITLTNFAPN